MIEKEKIFRVECPFCHRGHVFVRLELDGDPVKVECPKCEEIITVNYVFDGVWDERQEGD